jgi:SAM-dependent methyltransferase
VRDRKVNETTDQSHGVDRYIGRDDPGEVARLEQYGAGALDELRDGLALCAVPEAPRVLEIGCGTGVLTAALVEALPRARITAVDLNETLLATARTRLGDEAGPEGRVRLERADAAALPYGDRTFDLTACRCVLMHQADPMLVAGELYRVTSPGGAVVAVEPDWGARAVYPDAEAFAALLELARRGRSYGFPDLFMGRKLFAVLRAAGYAPVRLRARGFVSDADEVAAGASEVASGPWRLLEQGRSLLRSAGLIDDQALDVLIGRLQALRRSQDYCSAGVDVVAAAQKPSPRLVP